MDVGNKTLKPWVEAIPEDFRLHAEVELERAGVWVFSTDALNANLLRL